MRVGNIEQLHGDGRVLSASRSALSHMRTPKRDDTTVFAPRNGHTHKSPMKLMTAQKASETMERRRRLRFCRTVPSLLM